MNRKFRAFAGFFPYIAISLIPVITLIAVHICYGNILQKQYIRANKFVEAEMRQNISDTLTTIRSTYITVFDEVDETLTAEKLTSRELLKSKNVRDTVKNLQNTTKLSRTIDYIFIYLEDSDIIISSQGVTDSRLYYEAYFDSFAEGYDDWINLLKNCDKNENFSEVSINNEKYIECTISSDVLKPKFDINKNIILGALVSKEKFFADFSNESMDADGNTYIFDNNGRLILSNITQNQLSDLDIKSIDDILGIKGSEVVLKSYIELEERPCYYMYTVVPGNLYLKPLKIIKNISLFILILNIIFSFLALVSIAKKNYKPVLNAMKLLNKDGLKFQYTLIEDSIRNLLDSNDSLKYEVSRQKENFRQVIFERIINNEINDKMKFILLKYNINFIYDNYIVLVFRLYASENNITSDDLIDDMFEKGLESAFNDKDNIAYVFYTNSKYVCIVNTSSDDKKYNRTVAQISAYFSNMLKNKRNFNVSLGVSNLHSGLSGVSAAYFEALEAAVYADSGASNSMISLYEDISHTNNKYFTLDKENKILGLICDGNASGAIKEIDEVFTYLNNGEPLTTEYIVYDLICAILKLPHMIDLKKNKDIMNRLRFGYFLEYIKSLPKLRIIINELVSDITEVVKKRKKVANDGVIEVSKEYIHKNYSNPELSVSEISEYIRLSTVQFNTLFKRYCGTTPGEYINQYRIKTAKELLISGNDNVSEICEKVGFLNTRTFNRVFKKYTNMTPTEYKKTNIKCE